MVILITCILVVAALAAILDLQTSFSIETSPLVFTGGQNMREKITFLSELLYELYLRSLAVASRYRQSETE